MADAEHPTIKNFRSAIVNRQIDARKVRDFESWMNGKKFKEEYRPVAEELLAKAKALLASGSGNAGLPRPAQPASNKFGGKGRAPVPNNNRTALPASEIGYGFHNPYTFIPFPLTAPERHAPTPLTIDEVEKERLTGVLNIKLRNLSPLCSVQSDEKRSQEQRDKAALKIGNDVIVPASSVRGSLRSLMAIISGSALDYVDENLWLCQGRDLQLDKESLYLAEVVSTKPFAVRFGEAHLVKTRELLRVCNGRDYKQDFAKVLKKFTQQAKDDHTELWIDSPDMPRSWKMKSDAAHPWRVKVSGKKVDVTDNDSEGAFRPDETEEIELPESLKNDFEGRNRTGVKKTLQRGDLVWLEPVDPRKGIKESRHVKSIQWARWGRRGVNFLEKLKAVIPHMLPDYLQNDGKVDIVSDLFGSIPLKETAYNAFAARIRPENLVFKNAQTFWNLMPVSGTPHPGCMAFYVTNDDYDQISISDLPRGYKVYRTTSDHGSDAPWRYEVQPVYSNNGKDIIEYNVAKMTCRKELLKENQEGSLRIAFRGLSRKELALLLLTLSCDLRFGGGKPFGLGHCVVSEISAVNEFGEAIFHAWKPEKRASVPEEFQNEIARFLSRADLYCKTQIPVEMLRYPRAYKKNKHGGMNWFGFFAAPQQGNQDLPQHGLIARKVGRDGQLKAQGLPVFDPQNPASDLLFGYDVEYDNTGRSLDECIIPGGKDGMYKSYENTSQNRESRQAERNRR